MRKKKKNFFKFSLFLYNLFKYVRVNKQYTYGYYKKEKEFFFIEKFRLILTNLMLFASSSKIESNYKCFHNRPKPFRIPDIIHIYNKHYCYNSNQ